MEKFNFDFDFISAVCCAVKIVFDIRHNYACDVVNSFSAPTKKFCNGKRGTQLCRLAQRALCGVVAVQQRMKYAINPNEICVVKIHDKLGRFATQRTLAGSLVFRWNTRERE